MYSIIIFGPVFIFFFLIIFGSRLGGFYTALSVALSTFLSVLLSMDAFVFITYNSFNLVYYVEFFDIFVLNILDVPWHFYFDFLTLSIFCLITLVSFFIQLFSTSYMGEDASHVRFMVYLCFFIIAMLLLVGSANFIQIFFGWELVGLASFLLINFWFSRQDANISAFKAVAVNRVGDCFLLLSIFIFAYEYKTVSFDLIFSTFDMNFYTSLAFFFLTIGCFAKSAQFFFHVWLPDAMEGPTPVSALLHSATMVTAGVFLSLRFMDLLSAFSFIRYMVVFFGLMTAIYAISIAAVADDTKRVTAYTTLNQLGFMFFGCGSLAGATVLFHLIIHGFYKSFSFLSAAIELYDFEDEQDGEFDSMDLAGSYNFYDILTSLVFVSINAIPFTSPSISKEFILLSGLDGVPEYFSFFICLILFSSAVDEGRDDIDDQYDNSGYQDDLFVPGSFPPFILVGSCGLGLLSLFSSTFLEEIFIDMNFHWSFESWMWLDTKGSILIFLPFLSLVLSEFDFSRTGSSDFNNYTVFSREDSSYQSVLFNSELWYYDELVSRVSSSFLSLSNYLSNYILDKAFLEYLYVTYVFSLFRNIHFFIFNSRFSMEKNYSLSYIMLFFFSIIFVNHFFAYIWLLGLFLIYEYFIFNNRISKINYYHDL